MFGAVYTAEGVLRDSRHRRQLARNHIKQRSYQNMCFPWRWTYQVLSFRNPFDHDINIIISRTDFFRSGSMQSDWVITLWIYEQHDNVNPHKLRLVIIFSTPEKSGVTPQILLEGQKTDSHGYSGWNMVISCGVLKKSGVDFDVKQEAQNSGNRENKTTAKFAAEVGKEVVWRGDIWCCYDRYDIMENSMYHVKFRHWILFLAGTDITLYEIKMYLDNDVYMYHGFPQLTLPTTHKAHTHVATSMGAMLSFKTFSVAWSIWQYMTWGQECGSYTSLLLWSELW